MFLNKLKLKIARCISTVKVVKFYVDRYWFDDLWWEQI